MKYQSARQITQNKTLGLALRSKDTPTGVNLELLVPKDKPKTNRLKDLNLLDGSLHHYHSTNSPLRLCSTI